MEPSRVRLRGGSGDAVTGVRPAPRGWRGRVAWVAGLWSAAATLVGAGWAISGSGFPFGAADPRAGETGSYFGGAEPRSAGVLVAVLGAVGVGVAVAIGRRPGGRLLTAVASAYALALLVVVPDIRLLQNFAYLFFGFLGMVDAATGWMLAAVVGGVAWAAAGVVNASASPISPTSPTSPTSPVGGGAGSGSAAVQRDRLLCRWRRPVTITAALLALPYPVVRLSWAVGVPLGVPREYLDGADLMLRIGEAGLGLLAVGGAVLTLGLIRPWGEEFPRWVPGLRGRRVPVALAVVPGAWATILITSAGLRLTVWAVTDLDLQAWGMGGPGLFFLPWGLSVGAATYGYWAHRTGRCLAGSASAERRR